MKINYKIFFLLLLGTPLWAQQELSLPLMSHLANYSTINPSYIPDNTWTIRLPSIGFSLMHTGPSFNELYTKEASGVYQLDGNQATDQFDSNNLFSGTFSGDLLGLDYTWGLHTVSFSYGMYADAAVNYSDDGILLLLKGNGSTIGQTLSVGPALSINMYDKIGVGYAQKINQFSFGGRVNLLFGRKTLSTEEHSIQLTTTSDYYTLNLQTNYLVNSSDFVEINENTNDISFYDTNMKPGLGQNGFGIGIDLGAGYEVSEDIRGFVSVTNFGKINWKENVGNYSSHNNSNYDGVEIESLANLDTASLSGMLDSIQKFVAFEKSTNEFQTTLPTNYTLGGSWDISKKIRLDGAIMMKDVLDKYLVAAGVGVQYKVLNWAKLGGSISYQNKKVNHLGLNATIDAQPVQLFIATDNILTFLNPKSANTMHFRLGMNLLFGKVNKQKTLYGLGG